MPDRATLEAPRYFHVQRWPFYRLLLDDMEELEGEFSVGRVVVLERRIGGRRASPFADWFNDRASVIQWPIEALSDDPWCDFSGPFANPRLIVIYNLLHHIRDPAGFFGSIAKSASIGTYLYLFDAAVREWHQEPYHYATYTVHGAIELLARAGFDCARHSEIGGIVDSCRYLIDQARELTGIPYFLGEGEGEGEGSDRTARLPTAFSVLMRR